MVGDAAVGAHRQVDGHRPGRVAQRDAKDLSRVGDQLVDQPQQLKHGRPRLQRKDLLELALDQLAQLFGLKEKKEERK